MFQSIHERLENIAKEDNDREYRLGVACPIRLDLFLAGGHELCDVCLIDGLNSLDHHSIDVRHSTAPATDDEVWTVALAHVAMIRHRWPSEAEEQEAVWQAEAKR